MTFREFLFTFTDWLYANPWLIFLGLLMIAGDYAICLIRVLRNKPNSKNTLVYLHHADCGALCACNIMYYRKKKQFIVIPDFYYDDFCREADSTKEGSNGRKLDTDTGTNTGTDTLSHSGS